MNLAGFVSNQLQVGNPIFFSWFYSLVLLVLFIHPEDHMKDWDAGVGGKNGRKHIVFANVTRLHWSDWISSQSVCMQWVNCPIVRQPTWLELPNTPQPLPMNLWTHNTGFGVCPLLDVQAKTPSSEPYHQLSVQHNWIIQRVVTFDKFSLKLASSSL